MNKGANSEILATLVVCVLFKGRLSPILAGFLVVFVFRVLFALLSSSLRVFAGLDVAGAL